MNVTSSSSLRLSSVLFLLGILAHLETPHGQKEDLVIGKDICSCSPHLYNFTLDFTLSCPADVTSSSDGIAETSCRILPTAVTTSSTEDIIASTGVDGEEGRGGIIMMYDPNTSNDIATLTPTIIDKIMIIENNFFGMPIKVTEKNKTYQSGDSIYFQSSLRSSYSIKDVSVGQIPKSIIVKLSGRNSFGSPVCIEYGIKYTNDCSTPPNMFQSGNDYVGWTYIKDHQNPSFSNPWYLCPSH